MLGDVFMYDTAISEQTGASQLPQHCFSDLRKKEEDHKKKSNCFTLVYWLRSGMLVPLLSDCLLPSCYEAVSQRNKQPAVFQIHVQASSEEMAGLACLYVQTPAPP